MVQYSMAGARALDLFASRRIPTMAPERKRHLFVRVDSSPPAIQPLIMSFECRDSDSDVKFCVPDLKQNVDDWQRGFSLWRFRQQQEQEQEQEQNMMNNDDQLFLKQWISLQQDDYHKFKRGQRSFLYQQGFDVLARMGFEFDWGEAKEMEENSQRNENEKENSRQLSFQDVMSPWKGHKGTESSPSRVVNTSSPFHDNDMASSPAPLGDRAVRLQQSSSPNQPTTKLHPSKGTLLFPGPAPQCDSRDGDGDGGFPPGGNAAIEFYDDDDAGQNVFRHNNDDANNAGEEGWKTRKPRRRKNSGIGQRLKKKRIVMHPSFAIADEYEIPSTKAKTKTAPKPKTASRDQVRGASVEPKGSMSWDEWFGRLQQFYDAYGHVIVPANHHPPEQKVRSWLVGCFCGLSKTCVLSRFFFSAFVRLASFTAETKEAYRRAETQARQSWGHFLYLVDIQGNGSFVFKRGLSRTIYGKHRVIGCWLAYSSLDQVRQPSRRRSGRESGRGCVARKDSCSRRITR
jgi:hypothetical protein